MYCSIADAVTHALPSRVGSSNVDSTHLHAELDRVAEEALAVRQMGVPLPNAVNDPQFAALFAFHRDLRDAMFVEVPVELERWLEHLRAPAQNSALGDFTRTLTQFAQGFASDDAPPLDDELQTSLAELLLFETVRLRLLVVCWQTEEFERLGGEESDIDEIAAQEVSAILARPEISSPEIRPLALMVASASVALSRDAAVRASELQRTGDDLREQLSMRARLRAALRELRLPESILLENALSPLLGAERLELSDLQAQHPLALEGLSRQAMDQRVSRGRRALGGNPNAWPRRRRPALFDLLR